MIGYGEIAARLHADPGTVKANNPYFKWIETYIGDDYVQAIKAGRGICFLVRGRHSADTGTPEILEQHATEQSVARVEQLVQIFLRSTEVSIARSVDERNATR